MRLTKQSDYAVRTLMYCALSDDSLNRISDIARAYSISELFLFKIIKPLVSGGLIKTTRGRNGGITLARPADEITLIEAIKLTEDSFALAECFDADGSACPLVGHCVYNSVLNEALQAFFAVLAKVTIAELVADKSTMLPLLDMDEPHALAVQASA